MRRFRPAIAIAVVATIAVGSAAVGGSPAAAPTASAATIPPPIAITGAAVSAGPSSETLHGTVNPRGSVATYYFQYGTSTTYSSSTQHTNIGNGTSNVPVSATIGLLAPGTTYHFRVVAVNGTGAAYGADKTFATSPAAPDAVTGVATSTGPSSETLNGLVNPKGQVTTYFFEYGAGTTYGSSTPHATISTGTTDAPVSAAISLLVPGTIYHFRVVAMNSGGTTFGADKTFTTGQQNSQVRVMGREGFVSPGGVIGVEVGCFAGQTTCAGHIQMTHNGTIVGQRDYSIAPESGGFQNLKLTPAGQALLRQNSVWNLLGVDVTVKDTTGQTLTYVIHLARWVWH